MDIRSILANTATMLFLAGSSGEHVLANYKPTINTVMQVCLPTDNAASSMDYAKNPITGLRDVINWQLNNISYDKDLFLQQVRLKVGQDENTFSAIKMGIESIPHDELKVIGKIRSIKSTIDSNISKYLFLKNLDSVRFKLHNTSPGSEEEAALMAELQIQVETIKGGSKLGQRKNLVREIDLSNTNSVNSGFEDAMEVYNTDGIMKFGLQGFNDLFGDHQGLRRGETVVISALQHKWKSGALLSSAIQAAYFNEPTYLRLPAPEEGEEDHRKALILHVTLENDALGELLFIYKYIREQLTGEATSITNMSREERDYATKYVMEYFASRGYHFVINQFAAGDFDYSQLFGLIEQYEELGYEIHMVTLDYVGKMSTRGCTVGPHGKDIQDLYQRMQNFMLRKKIGFLTAHQMSTEAKALERGGEAILVKAVCELGYYAGCRTVDNEVDMEIYQHKVIIGDRHYLTWQRGKHRKPGNPTDENMKFCVYEMLPVATIPWDYDREPRYQRRIPGYGNNDVNIDMF